MAKTDSLYSTKIEVGLFDTSDKWAACPLSTLESALNNSAYVPANATVTKVVLHVTASWWCQGGASSNGYIRYGIGGTSSISKELVVKTSISGGANEDNASEYPSGGYDITTLLNTKVAPNVKFKTENGSYLTFCFSSPNNLKKRFHVKSVILDITYETARNITVKAGVGCSYISLDGGEVINSGQTRTFTLLYGSQFTLYSFPQDGYVFSHWLPSGDTRQHLPIVLTDSISVEAVYKLSTHTVIFKDYNGVTLQTSVIEHGGTVTPPTAPTKPETAQHKYTFDGWYDQNGNKWNSGTTITSDMTFTARYFAEVQKYTIRWFNYDGTPLETDTDVPYGTKPTYNGTTPTKPSDDYYTYGFAGWSPSTEEAIQGDKNFTAQFAQVDRYYTVRWVNASAVQGVEGKLLETDEVKFNTQPDYNGETPKHPKQDTDPALNYDFIGWSAKVTDPAKPDTELEKVKGNITYTAIYETTPKLYAITVILFDSQSTDVYEYGREAPIEAPEIVDFHRFVKWSDGDTRPSRTVTVTGEATYQAIYERIPIPIKVNLEQVTGCYIVPDASIPNTGTIVYVINGTVPTVEIGVNGDMQTVDGWSFLVSNSIPENGFPLKKMFITDKSGVTARIY